MKYQHVELGDTDGGKFTLTTVGGYFNLAIDRAENHVEIPYLTISKLKKIADYLWYTDPHNIAWTQAASGQLVEVESNDGKTSFSVITGGSHPGQYSKATFLMFITDAQKIAQAIRKVTDRYEKALWGVVGEEDGLFCLWREPDGYVLEAHSRKFNVQIDCPTSKPLEELADRLEALHKREDYQSDVDFPDQAYVAVWKRCDLVDVKFFDGRGNSALWSNLSPIGVAGLAGCLREEVAR